MSDISNSVRLEPPSGVALELLLPSLRDRRFDHVTSFDVVVANPGIMGEDTFAAISHVVSQMTHLDHLGLSGLGLQDSDLEHLCHGNTLKSRTLRRLTLQNNSIVRVPPGIVPAIQNLVRLDLSGNTLLQDVPISLADASHLEAVVVEGCNKLKLPKERTLEALREFRFGAVPWNRAKILVLGHGGCGKTSLLKAMRGQPLDPCRKSTIGVDVDQVSLDPSRWTRMKQAVKRKETLQLSVFDFAGQLEYTATHEHFLSSTHAVYIVVFSLGDARATQDEMIEYWLHFLLKNLSPVGQDWRVVVVGMKADLAVTVDGAALLDENGLGPLQDETGGFRRDAQGRFVFAGKPCSLPTAEDLMQRCLGLCPDITPFLLRGFILSGDLRHPLGRDLLSGEIKRFIREAALQLITTEAAQMRTPLNLVPKRYKQLADDLQQMQRDALPLLTVLQVVRENSAVPGSEAFVGDGLRYLHSIGAIILRPAETSFVEGVICTKPQWLAKVMAAFVGSHLTLKANLDGSMNKQQVVAHLLACDLVSHGAPIAQDSIDRVMEILIQFSVCFVAQERFIFPSLRLPWNPDEEWRMTESHGAAAVRVGRRFRCSRINRAMILSGDFCQTQIALHAAYGDLVPFRIHRNCCLFRVRTVSDRGVGTATVLVLLHRSARDLDVVVQADSPEDAGTATREVLQHVSRLDAVTSGTWVWLCPRCIQSPRYIQRPTAGWFLDGTCETGQLECSRFHQVQSEDIRFGQRYVPPFVHGEQPWQTARTGLESAWQSVALCGLVLSTTQQDIVDLVVPGSSAAEFGGGCLAPGVRIISINGMLGYEARLPLIERTASALQILAEDRAGQRATCLIPLVFRVGDMLPTGRVVRLRAPPPPPPAKRTGSKTGFVLQLDLRMQTSTIWIELEEALSSGALSTREVYITGFQRLQVVSISAPTVSRSPTDPLVEWYRNMQDAWLDMLGEEDAALYSFRGITALWNPTHTSNFEGQRMLLRSRDMLQPSDISPHQAWVLRRFQGEFLSRFGEGPTQQGHRVVMGWWGKFEAVYFAVAEHHFAGEATLDDGFFSAGGFYFSQYPKYSREEYARQQCSLLCCWLLPGQPYPVTESAVPGAVPTLNGVACDERSPCRRTPSLVPVQAAHDSHYVVVSPPAMDCARCPPESDPPYFDEIVIFERARILPAFIVHFEPRMKHLLWVDNNPENNVIVDTARRLGVHVEIQQSCEGAKQWLHEHTSLGQMPPQFFRIITSRHLGMGDATHGGGDLFSWLCGRVEFAQTPLLIYHGGRGEQSWKHCLALRQMTFETARAVDAQAFAQMDLTPNLRRQADLRRAP